MKHLKLLVLTTAVLLLAGFLAQPAHADVTFDLAYSSLHNHGSWMVSAQYGHVWQPREYNRDWNPYYDGHWVYTEMGWTWVSDYEWGAIPYHYGTWIAEPGIGWVWIPGRVWAPSWVVFRTGPDYIGWAPVPPGFSIGMSIDMGGSSNFVFVSSREFMAPRIRASIIPVSRTNVFINNTTIVNNIVIQNNIVVNNGPDIRIIEKATGRPVRHQRIESVARVAPFAKVDRAQLSVDPERAKHGVRVSEPVPSSQPLPVSNKGGKGKGKGKVSQADTPKSPSGHSAEGSSAQKPETQSEAVTPGTTAGTATKQESKSSSEPTAKPQPTPKASTEPTAKSQPAPKASTEPTAKSQPAPKARTEPSAKAQQTAKASADKTAQAAANAKAKADVTAKAKADKAAKSQAIAKAKAQKAKDEADAKAKAQDPNAAGESSEPTPPKSEEEGTLQ